MVEKQDVQIIYKLTASASSEGDVEIYTVPGGRNLVVEEISVGFDPETEYDLEVSFYDGIRKVAPTDGVYVGKAIAFNTLRKIVFQEGSKVIVHYKNTNTTTARTAVIEIKGHLEMEK